MNEYLCEGGINCIHGADSTHWVSGVIMKPKIKIIIEKFLKEHSEYERVEWEQGDLTVYLKGSNIPREYRMYLEGSIRRNILVDLENNLWEAEENETNIQME